MYKALTQGEIEQLRRIRPEYTLQELAGMFYVSARTIKKYCTGAYKFGKGWKPLTKGQVYRIQTMRKCGLSYGQIKKQTGLSNVTIVKHCKAIKQWGSQEVAQ